MLDRSIPTREALVHSIPTNEVIDMKSDVLRALKAFLSEKKVRTLFASSILTIFKKNKFHRLRIYFCNISIVGIDIFKIHLKFDSNSVFRYLFQLIDLLKY
jgi:hypothetical protein